MEYYNVTMDDRGWVITDKVTTVEVCVVSEVQNLILVVKALEAARHLMQIKNLGF